MQLVSCRLPIERFRAGTECVTWDEQYGISHGGGCMDHPFAVKLFCEKYLANSKDEIWALMDLEKVYDMID